MKTERHFKLHGLLILIILILLAAFTNVEILRRNAEQRARQTAQPVSSPTVPAVTPALRENLSNFENNTIEIFRRVSPSVVSVGNKAIFRDLFGFQLYEIPQGVGSGCVWDKEGHILSNFHVIYEASSIQVTLQNGANFSAEVVGVDPDHDIAVLQIRAPESTLTPIPLGTSRDLQVGQNVMAIGNPFGLDTSLSLGIVSALGRSIISMTGRRIYDVIQTDAAINPGNSGGPLLDSTGRLIGLNTAIVTTSGSYAGVGFAVPVDTVRRIVPQLIAFGKVPRVGIGIQTVPDHLTRRAEVVGVAIFNVQPRSPAGRAGLQGLKQTPRGNIVFGDILVEVDGSPVKCNNDLAAIMDRHQAGDIVKMTYLRGNERLTVELTLENEE
ncbi:MAG: trypsin-like peptidase domain-containing protein [Kiritimatiellae bacterium]|nr:trypsin-like peptidase domain-containing protein [Verrucomicrobiota bacterium]MCG2660550.1 trypsin-like peptidase domain-containing protein [Kiritimatiellia bacterium]